MRRRCSCPCQNYLSTKDVIQVLGTRAICIRCDGDDGGGGGNNNHSEKDELDILLSWLSGKTKLRVLPDPDNDDDPVEGSSKSTPTATTKPTTTTTTPTTYTFPCTPRDGGGRCRNRIECSFRFLNDLRNACRPFLLRTPGGGGGGGGLPPMKPIRGSTAATTARTPRDDADKPVMNVNSQAEFPALTSPAMTTATATAGQLPSSSLRSKKDRKRIRPAIIPPSSLLRNNPPWNNNNKAPWTDGGGTVWPYHNNHHHHAGNLADAPDLLQTSTAVDDAADSVVVADFVQPRQQTNHQNNATARGLDKKSPRPPHHNQIMHPREGGDDKSQRGALTGSAAEPIKAHIVVEKESHDALSANVPLNNLATFYSMLIDSCMVPSSLDEIHLLLTLLACPPDTSVGMDANPVVVAVGQEETSDDIGRVLCSTVRCRYFAAQVLRLQRSLLCLIVPMIPQLRQCTVLTDAVPELVTELETSLVRYQSQKSREPTRLSSQHSALLTLPFRPRSDCKHNYKSPKEARGYKNREDTRDAFLYQLRTFLNERGKIFDAKQSHSAIEKIKRAARGIVSDVHEESNMSWFAEFFADMLIRLGNMPIQETDSDVLQIADKEKLQALHRRFSTKTGSTKVAIKKIAVGVKDDDSPYDAAQRYFTHHQEFFFLFVTSANCYTFSMHLRATLIRHVKDQLDQASTNNLDILGILGRFLGVLIFSPNWLQAIENGTMMKEPDLALDSLHILGSCGLLLPKRLQRSKTSDILFAIELLSMSKWDTRTVRSPVYLQSLQVLRGIQLNVCRARNSIVSLWIETFFGEFSDLARASAVFDDALSFEVEECFTLQWPHHLDTRVEELESLVKDISNSSIASHRLPGASRKLRPSAIDNVGSNFPGLGSVAGHSAPLASLSRQGDFLSKLGDSFFHQHAVLKSMCEFSINQTFAYVEGNIESECFSRIDQPGTSGQEEFVRLHNAYTNSAHEYLNSKLKSHTKGVLQALCPSFDEFVVEEAVSLSCQAGMVSGKDLLNEVIMRNVDTARAAVLKLERKLEFSSNGDRDGPQDDVSRNPCKEHVAALTTVLSHVATTCQEGNSLDAQLCSAVTADGLAQVRAIKLTVPTLENQYASDKELRSFFASACRLLDNLQRMGRVIGELETNTSNELLLSFMDGALIAAQLRSYSKQSILVLRGIFNRPSFMASLFHKVALSSQLLSNYRTLVDELVNAHIIRRQNLTSIE